MSEHELMAQVPMVLLRDVHRVINSGRYLTMTADERDAVASGLRHAIADAGERAAAERRERALREIHNIVACVLKADAIDANATEAEGTDAGGNDGDLLHDITMAVEELKLAKFYLERDDQHLVQQCINLAMYWLKKAGYDQDGE